jgi:predicted dehydrogenase
MDAKVADIWEEGAIKACQEFNVPAYTKEWSKLVTSPQVDAVIICSPTDQVG